MAPAQEVDYAWAALIAARSRSGACVIGIWHMNSGTALATVPAAEMPACRAADIDTTRFNDVYLKGGRAPEAPRSSCAPTRLASEMTAEAEDVRLVVRGRPKEISTMNTTGARLLAAAVALGGAALIAWYCTELPAEGLPVASCCWQRWCGRRSRSRSTPSSVAVTRAPTRTMQPSATDDDVTVVVVATGDDPDEVVRTSAALAQAAGPVVLVDLSASPRHGLASALGVLLAEGDGEQGAIDAALTAVTTPCVTVVRARACVVADELRAAAGRVVGDTGWVTGRTEVYNDDGFSPAYGHSIGDALRDRARRNGIPLWAPDATVMRTEAAVAAGGFRPDRPWGSVLRRMAAAGFRGTTHPGVLTAIAAPAEAEPFWRIRVSEARADVSEATDVVVSPGCTARGRGQRGPVLRGWSCATFADG